MRRSNVNPPILGIPCELPCQSATRCGRVQLPIARWGWMAVLGILASVFAFLAERMKPDQDSADGGMLGTHTAAVQSVAFDPMGAGLPRRGLTGQCTSGI